MDFEINWPWEEMLVSSTVMFTLILGTVLLINKYPSSRMLGVLVYSNLLLLFSFAFPVNFHLGLFALIFIAFNLFSYVRTFFIQNISFSFKKIIPLIIAYASLAVYSLGGIDALWFQGLTSVILFIVITIYVFRLIKRIKSEGEIKGVNWFLNPGSRLAWFRNFVILNVLLLSIWSFHEYIPVHVIAVTVLLNSGYIYVQVFKESSFLSPIPIGNKYQKSTLTPEQKFSILNKMDQLLEEEKFFLENDISLGKLAKALHTNTHHLSQVINESKGCSFQELIGKYRIKKAKELLKHPDKNHLKIENIATIVGYNSKSAFNTAFKKYTGLTPTQFKESKEVLTYREERRPERKRPWSASFSFDLNHISTFTIETNMITNFFKIFYRTLIRNKTFTVLNLFGLAIGFSASILIYLFVTDENSFDQQLPDSDRIYRIGWLNENPQTRTPHPMAQAMVNDMPEVEIATSISPVYGVGLSKTKVRVKNVNRNLFFEEPDFYYTDSTFLDIFQLEVVAGDKDALRKPWNIVITEEMALKYFGKADPIGDKLNINDTPLAVAAVVKSMPKNSHFHFKALISYVTIKTINPNDNWYKWGDFGHFNYIKLKDGVDHTLVETNIPNWISSYLDWRDEDLESLKSGLVQFVLQPIESIHLESHLRWELENNGNILYIYILTGTLIFILIIVTVNYINLTTAKSLERAREIGIRKTLGAFSGNIKIQFYLESICFCFVSLLIALIFSILLLNYFNQLTGKSFSVNDILNFGFMIKAILGCFLIAFIAGAYPAFVLSSFKPTDVLKGKSGASFQGNNMRSALVVLQFFVSTILIVGSLIILSQINFMKSKQLGFDKEAIISIEVHESAAVGDIPVTIIQTAQQQIAAVPGVRQVSGISNLPGGQFNQHRIYSNEDLSNVVDASEMFVDFNIKNVLNYKMVAGRDFDRSFSADSAGANVIINESAVQQLNLSEPVGKKITWIDDDEHKELYIVGIVNDFHYKSLHESIQPLLIMVNPYRINNIIVKLEGNNFSQSLEKIAGIYQSYEKDFPFEYHFLDDQLSDLYDAEIQTLNVFSIFAGLAVFLACLGLIGMAIAMLNQKVKEIGIRKILGASANQLMVMILNQFTRLIGIALLLGLPVGYLLTNNWLAEFSYRVTLGLTPFIIAGLILFTVAILSISIVIIRIVFSNPIEAIRYE